MSKLSHRLEKALGYTKGFTTLADVGTDHAYLPIQAVSMGYVKEAIAIDNKPKPLDNARRNVAKAGLENQIETVLADGLTSIKKPCDVISILGMGGDAVVDILAKADLTQVKRLVLSPNSEYHVVREWLEKNHFLIEDEHYLEDKHKYYQLIVAKPGEMTLTMVEREFGPINLKRRNTTFQDHLNHLVYQLQSALNKTRNSSDQEALKERINLLKGLMR